MRLHGIKARWIAGFVIASALGTAVSTGTAVASADPNTTAVGESAEATPPSASDGDYLSKRRRATFSGACVTEVKVADFDANNN